MEPLELKVFEVRLILQPRDYIVENLTDLEFKEKVQDELYKTCSQLEEFCSFVQIKIEEI